MLTHVTAQSDTDIFPHAFEFDALAAHWKDSKTLLQQADVLSWKGRDARRCLVPKHKYGFRVSTQLDPLDFIVYTALIHEVGKKLEAARIPTSANVVHSYRFAPTDDGRMFSDEFTYRTFQKTSHHICTSSGVRYVAIADIADFFPRLYTHRVENALDAALGAGHMHGTALKQLMRHWSGPYSYGIPVGSTASRLLAEVTISDIDAALLSEGATYARYSDDFRFFCKSEADAYKFLTLVARFLLDNHGLTLQQHKTKILGAGRFRSVYLRENEEREVDTLSERFYGFLDSIGIQDPYEEIDFDALLPEQQAEIAALNLESLLTDQLRSTDPDIALTKFLLRRLRQIGNVSATALVVDKFSKFVPVVREAIEYLLHVPGLSGTAKADFGKRLLSLYKKRKSLASHLEYARMYMLHPFAVDDEWNNEGEYVSLYNEAVDEFSTRELVLALGRSRQDFWFRARKQTASSMAPWVRRAFIYGASCMPADEYNHWTRGRRQQMDPLETIVAQYGKGKPIAAPRS